MGRPAKYSEELRERAVRLVFESGRPIRHVAADLGVGPEALRLWVRRAEKNAKDAPGGNVDGVDRLTGGERAELVGLRREVKDLRRANEILRAASVFFAKELDPPRSR